jgi:hypothetical protein
MVARTVAAGPVLRVQQPPAMILMPAPRCFFEKTDRKKMKRSLYFFLKYILWLEEILHQLIDGLYHSF